MRFGDLATLPIAVDEFARCMHGYRTVLSVTLNRRVVRSRT